MPHTPFSASVGYRWLLLFRGELPWSDRDPEENAVFRTPLDKAEFASDIERASAAHVLAQYGKFARWLDGEDAVTAARALLVLCSRGILLLRRKIEQAHGDFLARGGFAENLSKDRIEARAAGAATDAAEGKAPRCPKCGKPMQRRLAKRGVRAGKVFWSCPDYPECRGARDAE
jgi:four helix bundle suffix protein